MFGCSDDSGSSKEDNPPEENTENNENNNNNNNNNNENNNNNNENNNNNNENNNNNNENNNNNNNNNENNNNNNNNNENNNQQDESCDYTQEETYRKCTDNNGVGVYSYCHPDNKIMKIDCDGACIDATSCKLSTGDCAPGANKCEGGDSLFSPIGASSVCNQDGTWREATACPSSVCTGTRCGQLDDSGICEGITEARCQNGEDGVGIIVECTESTRTLTACPNSASCKNEYECGDCKDSDSKCEDTTETISGKEVKIGNLSVCENGEWKTDVCKYKRPCADDEKSCESCEIQSCENKDTGGYGGKIAILTLSCPSEANASHSCGQVTCTETNECGECRDGGGRCEDREENGKQIGYRYSCDKGRFVQPTKCENDVSCNGEYGCGDCQNGDTKCEVRFWAGQDRGYMKVCIDGRWQNEVECPTGACTSDNKMCEYSGDQLCVQQEYEKIGIIVTKDGEGYKFEKCASEVSCNAEKNNCGACKDNDSSCVNNEDKVGQLTKCENGEWTTNPCENNTSCSCNGSSGYNCAPADYHYCGRCVEGTIESCSNRANDVGYIRHCRNGSMKDEACPNKVSCNEDNTDCAPCTDGMKYCLNSGGKTEVGTCSGGVYTDWQPCASGLCNDDYTDCKPEEPAGE